MFLQELVKCRSLWNTILWVLKLYIGSTEKGKIHRTYIWKGYLAQRKHPLLTRFLSHKQLKRVTVSLLLCSNRESVTLHFFAITNFPKHSSRLFIVKTLLLPRSIFLSVFLDLLNWWECINSFGSFHTLFRIQLFIIPKLADSPLFY